jgi:DNA-binding transcriptional LysR family regulator
MSLDRLIIFAAVAKHRNVSRASQELHISQPAVTKQIKLLEKEYSTMLFTRGGRGVQLTEMGKTFLKDVRKLIERYETLREKFGAVTLESSFQALRVGGSYSPSASFLPSLLAEFAKTHPRVQLNLCTDNRLAVEGMVLTGQAELAVINNPQLNRRLTMEPLRSEAMVAFVSPSHPMAKKKRLAWEDFTRAGFIIRSSIGGRGIDHVYTRHLKKNGFTPNVILRCDTPTAVKEAVRKKLGIGVLYRDVVAGDIARGEFKAIKMPGGALESKSYIIYRRNRPLTPVARDFLKLLRSRKISK